MAAVTGSGDHSPAVATRVSTAINGTAARIRMLRCIVYTDGMVKYTVEWQEELLSAEYRLFVSGNLHILHQSREMEVSLPESSRRNLARIVR